MTSPVWSRANPFWSKPREAPTSCWREVRLSLPGLIRKFWDIAAHYKINSFSGVPTVYSSLLQVPRSDRR